MDNRRGVRVSRRTVALMPDSRLPDRSPPPPLRTLARRSSRLIFRHRRVVAALLAAMAVAFAVSAVAPTPPARVSVLAATRDLPAGVALSTDDVGPRDVPPELVPAGALRPGDDVAGRLIAGPVDRGELLTARRLVSPSLLHGLTAEAVATPVRIADAGSVRLLRSGDSIDVLAAGEGGDAAPGPADVVAEGVRVLAVPTEEEPGAARTDGGGLVVLATTPAQAAVLASAAVSARLSIVLRRH